MAAIQFYGIDAVVNEIQFRDSEDWELLQGRQKLFSGNDDDLKGLLSRMVEGGSDAVYTLRYFDDGKEAGSFNFKFSEGSMYGIGRVGGGLEKRLAGIEAALKQKEPTNDSAIGRVMDYVENNPFIQRIIMGMAGKYLNIPGLTGDTPVDEAVTALSGVAEDDDRRIAAAIARLKNRVPVGKLGEYLSKLAAMEEGQFRLLISAMEQM